MAFDAEWLALREPADHAARDGALLSHAVQAAGPSPRILDLACGTGSTVRAFSAFLRDDVTWRLLDNDPDLLNIAKSTATESVETRCFDIADPEALPFADITLVTASALLDLVSKPWIEALVATLCARRLPFYAALSYDGRMIWDPTHEEDCYVTEAFNAHQLTDKGFGPALGPRAVQVAKAFFENEGYQVHMAQSDWCFPAGRSILKDKLTRDIASASEEAGFVSSSEWQRVRVSRALTVGHCDLLALPPESRSS